MVASLIIEIPFTKHLYLYANLWCVKYAWLIQLIYFFTDVIHASDPLWKGVDLYFYCFIINFHSGKSFTLDKQNLFTRGTVTARYQLDR